MTTAIVFLLILTVSVVVHELAHYYNARSVGVPVRAFSVGLGPVLLRKQWRGTEWRLSLLPLGGYVDIPGLAAETDEEGNLHHPKEGFATKTIWQKLWILVGGVIANTVLAILLLSTVITAEPNYRAVTAGMTPSESGTIIQEVVEGSPADALGVMPGDVVLELGGTEDPTRTEVQQTIANTTGELDLVLQRGENTVTLSTDWPPPGTEGTPMLGVRLAPRDVGTLPQISFPQAMLESAAFIVRIVPETVRGFVTAFGQAFTGQQSEEIAGPVGIVQIVGQAAQTGVLQVLFIAALINFSLAIFNLLPIPGLDGGRMLLATIVAVRGKPFKPGQEEFIHFLGFVTILVFIVLVTFGEISELLRS